MNTTFVQILVLLSGALIGYFLTRLTGRNSRKLIEQQHLQQLEQTKEYLVQGREEAEERLKQALAERELLRQEKDDYRQQVTQSHSELVHLRERMKEQQGELEKLQDKFSIQFENLANKILEQKTEKFTLLNKENISRILDPLQEKIRQFEEKVEKNASDFTRRNAELDKQLQLLNQQNIKISEEATNLTRALKGDHQKQGSWGEIILERVLERSGLHKDQEYFVQHSFTSEEGRKLRPDVIISLPGNRKLIIDSKVSLNAYDRYCGEEDKEVQAVCLKEHLRAIRDRVNELSKKDYQLIYEVESPDFVLLFVPIEAAFAVASREYPALYSEAFEKNIIIVTPTTLLAVLRTIDSMWQSEKQKQNAIEIATQAGRLYDSFTGLTEELLKVGRQMTALQNSYDGAMKKLTGKGNLATRVEKLKKLGAKASKEIDGRLLQEKEEEQDKEVIQLK